MGGATSPRTPAVPPIARPIRSFIATAGQQQAEVAMFPCVDVVEITADKLSALAWRVRVRQRGGPRDDPTIIRYLYDLAALEAAVASAPNFRELVLAADIGSGGEKDPPTDRRSSSPACCSGSKSICFGRGNMRISCGSYRSPAP